DAADIVATFRQALGEWAVGRQVARSGIILDRVRHFGSPLGLVWSMASSVLGLASTDGALYPSEGVIDRWCVRSSSDVTNLTAAAYRLVREAESCCRVYTCSGSAKMTSR